MIALSCQGELFLDPVEIRHTPFLHRDPKPGSLTRLSRFTEGGAADTRNSPGTGSTRILPPWASMMRHITICKERGCGIDRAIDGIEFFWLPAPEFLADHDFMRITLLGHQNTSEMGRADKTRACYQLCCLRWVCRDYMTNATLRKRLGIDDQNYPMTSRIIKDTMDQGLIRLYKP